MRIQIITFQLRDLSVEEFNALCDSIAEQWSAIPGLISKVWLANEDTNTYGGVYTWETREAMEVYLQSDLFNGIVSNPRLVNTTSANFDIFEGPTRVTRGLVAAVV